MNKGKTPYEVYQTKMRKIADLKYAAAVLQWDQETYLPEKGAVIRGQQIATLTEMAHSLFVEKHTGNLLDKLLQEKGYGKKEKRNVQLSKEDYEKSKKLPVAFVRELSEAINTSFHFWLQARRASDYRIFEPYLHQLVELKKKEADLLGYHHHPYDALMDQYEKGFTVKKADQLFATLEPALKKLIRNIQPKQQVATAFLTKHYPQKKQWDLGLELLRRIGFDFKAGRQDLAEHPFTTNFNSRDVRLTTRIDEQDLANMTWSCLHEGGHGLYEQGLPVEDYGLPSGEYCSLGIHESQSRFWENCIGRSRIFWEANFGLLKEYFPVPMKGVTIDTFFKAINCVTPSLIRTEADELTYHFHVMIRYEIERDLITGKLSTKDLPERWNDLYFEKLGIRPKNDLEGCLQDVHWCHGSFGYFPTYSLGSLYAAQFYHAMCAANRGMEKEIAAGNLSSVLQWLRENIHSKGRLFTSEELCQQISGEGLNVEFFIKHAAKKYKAVYSGK